MCVSLSDAPFANKQAARTSFDRKEGRNCVRLSSHGEGEDSVAAVAGDIQPTSVHQRFGCCVIDLPEKNAVLVV